MLHQAQQVLQKSPRSLEIFLVSEGGDLSVGLALHDAIYTVPKSAAVASGICASAGILILQAANERYATVNTHFIVHKGFYEIPDDLTEDQQLECKNQNKYLDNAARSVLNKRVGFQAVNEAYDLNIFDAKTALNLGFIDGIVDPRPNRGWLGRKLRPEFVDAPDLPEPKFT